MKSRILLALTAFALAGLTAAAAHAVTVSIPVANHSFENPTVTVAQQASPFVDNWVTDGTNYDGGPINLNTGIFPNTEPGDPARIDNLDGKQAAFLATETGNEFTQTLGASFETDRSYTLTVAVARSYYFPPSATDVARLGLFYLDTNNLRQLVAWTDLKNDTATGLSGNHFVDFSAVSGLLPAGHPAVGQPIQVLLASVGAPGGFFDLDNVRVTMVPEPASCGMAMVLIMAASLVRRRVR